MKKVLGFGLLFLLVVGIVACGPGKGTKEPSPEGQREQGTVTEREEEPTARERKDAGEPQPEAILDQGSPDGGGSDGSVGEVDLPEDVSASWICRETATIACKHMFRCCTSFGLKDNDEGGCVSRLQKRCEDTTYKKEDAAHKAGLVSVSRENLTTCLQALEKAGASCHIPTSLEARMACREIFLDPAASGETCKSNIGDLRCDAGKGTCFVDPLGAKCKTWGQAGAQCSAAPCHPSLFCKLPQGGGQGTCEAYAAKGGSCEVPAHCQAGLACLNKVCAEQLAVGEKCDNVLQCKDGACDISSGTGVCVATKKEGEACQFQTHCGSGLFCHGLAVGTVCQKGAAEGETCKSKRDCAAGLGCNSEKCAPLPKENEACDPGNGCSGDLICTNSKCAPYPTDGQACIRGEKRCADGFACFNESGNDVCRAARKEGESCTSHEECQRGFGCDQSKCVSLPKAGSPCLSGILCALDAFCDLDKKMCESKKAVGGSCPIGFECQDGLSCIPSADGKSKSCQEIPKEGQACSTTCAAGLTCKPGVKPGICAPTICAGELKE